MAAPSRDCVIDVLKGSVLTLSLFLAYVTIPVLGIAAGMAAPLPVLVYSLSGSRVRGVVIVVIAMTVLGVIAGPLIATLYLLQVGAIALALAVCLGRRCTVSGAILAATAIVALLCLAVAVAYDGFSGADVHGQIVAGINASAAQAVGVYARSGVTGEDLATLKKGMEQMTRVMAQAYPALLVLFIGMVAGANMLVLKRLGPRWGVALPEAPFLSFRLPEPLVWLVIAAGFLLLAPAPTAQLVSYNLLAVLGVLYFFQGMAVVAALVGRMSVPAAIRIFIYLLIGVQPYLMVAVAVLGLFDIWGDFRVPRQKNL